MTKFIPIPYDFCIPGYGLHHPMIDGLLVARQLIEHNIPDYIMYEEQPDEHNWVKEHNEYKDKVLADLDRRIEEIKRHIR